jgi:hypothetical protein
MSHFSQAHCFVARETNQLLQETKSWQEMRGTLPYLISEAGSFQLWFQQFLLHLRFSWRGGSTKVIILFFFASILLVDNVKLTLNMFF